jgi:hypothetical protein
MEQLRQIRRFQIAGGARRLSVAHSQTIGTRHRGRIGVIRLAVSLIGWTCGVAKAFVDLVTSEAKRREAGRDFSDAVCSAPREYREAIFRIDPGTALWS